MNESKYRVLLVDDEPNLRKVLSALLIQQGFAVHVENDGEAALTRVRSAPADTFDVVISDLRMPNMNGMEACRTLRGRGDTQAIPIIMVTTRGESDMIEEAFAAGCTDYVTKPIDGAELTSKISNLIGD